VGVFTPTYFLIKECIVTRFNRGKKSTEMSLNLKNLDIKKKAKEDIEYLTAQIDSINVDDIKNEEVHLRLGNRIYKLVCSGDIDETYMENRIRKEFKKKLSEKLDSIKRKINTKLNQMSEFVVAIKEDYKEKEAELVRKLDSVATMPEISYSHAEKGLSVVRGHGPNKYYWLVQGIYWPKYVDHEPIDPEFSVSLITPVIILVETNGDKIVKVSVRKPLGLARFQQYHTIMDNEECWGNWNYERKWKTPNDIIKIGQEAQIILENINSGSLGNREPSGLPSIETVKRHVKKKGKIKDAELNKREERMGVSPQSTHVDGSNIWST
jgi:hypothetical protein